MSAPCRPKAPKGVTRAAVLAYLIREADMDGLVTVSDQEVAAAVGVHRTAIQQHIKILVAQGVLAPQGHTTGVASHAINAYLIAEDAVA